MAIPSSATPPTGNDFSRIFGRARLITLVSLLATLALCLVLSWMTRDSMDHLPTARGQATALDLNRKTLVDQRPWRTAQALAPLAVTSEENELAREAQRLADHEVDQAFASALRLATLQVQRRNLTGESLALSRKVAQLQQMVKDDQALVKRLTPAAGAAGDAAKSGDQPTAADDDLELAKAQLGLDVDQLADAQQDLARASGDDRSQIQDELAEREAAMRKYDNGSGADGQVAVLSAAQYGTLAGRLKAWSNQRDRHRLIQQALGEAQADIASLTAEHNELEAQANASAGAGAGAGDQASKLASLKERSQERQMLSIYDDRIQTQQRLAAVYEKWSAQVLLQHRILWHLILQSLALIAFLVIGIILCDALVERLMSQPALDRRRRQTLRTILKLGVQMLGTLLVLFVIFGTPRQISTIVGLATAGLTVVLQDFILAFFGWFTLMGRNGLRVGDWVEINGVAGEVIDIGLFRTTLLETGNWTDAGHPTGRRVTLINSFAIRGQYFNFSTTGQWMWDEILVSVPAGDDKYAMVERIHQAVLSETEPATHAAEEEWKRGMRQDGLSQFSAAPSVDLRPSAAGVDIMVRYVTQASERFEMRNRLYQRVVEVLHKPEAARLASPRETADAR